MNKRDDLMSSSKSFFQILSLCLRSICPVCGQGRLFVSIFKLRSVTDFFLPPHHCQSCGFQFRREAGYYFGVLTPLLPLFSLATGLCFVLAYYLTVRPEDPYQLLLPGALGTACGFIFFFRSAIAIYISLDHAIDPPRFPPPQQNL